MGHRNTDSLGSFTTKRMPTYQLCIRRMALRQHLRLSAQQELETNLSHLELRPMARIDGFLDVL